MKSTVVFLAGLGLHVFGIVAGDERSQTGGAMLFGLGLLSMVVSWMIEKEREQ